MRIPPLVYSLSDSFGNIMSEIHILTGRKLHRTSSAFAYLMKACAHAGTMQMRRSQTGGLGGARQGSRGASTTRGSGDHMTPVAIL
ncbi:hypothetical protein AG1IA_09502 [Rhizoctonia solani AG-1 IA]|uniref:Uncharacterized protein n=1 Tax=Thanatephorus cucumeris (strain AG1-IA) TaxID=983506 RepID=L8WI44_THACA|nr:hypothetical protein AG1IA_09502 [Rhizoctonia solani AG-1 IA]